jgi:hypothetical protein
VQAVTRVNVEQASKRKTQETTHQYHGEVRRRSVATVRTGGGPYFNQSHPNNSIVIDVFGPVGVMTMACTQMVSVATRETPKGTSLLRTIFRQGLDE